MPQMGESIAEGTVVRWLKQVGDSVKRDEPLFELSTDKVDAEIPSPATGVLSEIRVNEGETVPVDTVVAVISCDLRRGEFATSLERTATGNSPTMPNITSQPVRSESSLEQIKMPQMGESIPEGTVTKWIKQVGDSVRCDEPLFEISTDKVDAEIPAPVSGVLYKIVVGEGETVPVNTVVALIDQGGGADQAPVRNFQDEHLPANTENIRFSGDEGTARTFDDWWPTSVATKNELLDHRHSQDAVGKSSGRLRPSPLARQIAREHSVDLSKVLGTGIGGRITKHDILEYIREGKPAEDAAVVVQEAAVQERKPAEGAVVASQEAAVQEDQYDVFISYRREGGSELARAVRSELRQQNCKAFLDVADLGPGSFNEALLRRIEMTPNFIVILSPNCLDRCLNERDWLRLEIARAIATGRKIVPIIMRGFQFPDQQELPEDLSTLPNYQSVEYNHSYFEAMIAKIVRYTDRSRAS